MEIISNKYNDLCQTSSDINEHLPTLYEYAKKCNSIFSYDPNYKQISLKVGTTTKCIDAFNENDIVLNDCIKNSQKQKFDYYPFFNDGKLYSGLYSKCISYNKESNILGLTKCEDDNNIIVSNSIDNLYLQNK